MAVWAEIVKTETTDKTKERQNFFIKYIPQSKSAPPSSDTRRSFRAERAACKLKLLKFYWELELTGSNRIWAKRLPDK